MNRQTWPIFVVSLALIAAGGVFIQHRKAHQRLGIPAVKVAPVPILDPEGNVVGTNSVAWPETVGEFKSEPEPVPRRVLEWLPADTTYGQRRYYAADKFEIASLAILMGADRTSIHKPQYCLAGSGWRIVKEEPDTVTILRPRTYELPVRKMTLLRDVQLPSGQTVQLRGCYVYWFAADGQLTADHNQRMWWMARDLIRTGVLQRWAYMACLAVTPPGKEAESYQRVKDFVAAAVPDFHLIHGRTDDQSALRLNDSRLRQTWGTIAASPSKSAEGRVPYLLF